MRAAQKKMRASMLQKKEFMLRQLLPVKSLMLFASERM
jgi:hypothetical protein